MSHSSYRMSYAACDFMQESTFMHVSTHTFSCIQSSNIVLMQMGSIFVVWPTCRPNNIQACFPICITLRTMTPHTILMQVSYQYWCGSYNCCMIGHENISCSCSSLKVATVTSSTHDELCFHCSNNDVIVQCYSMAVNGLKYPKLHQMRIILFQGHD